MKKMQSLLVLSALVPVVAIAQPGGPMSFKDAAGSVLTLNGFGQSQTSGSYLDAVGLGGCPKGQTYNIPQISITGQPMVNGTISFKAALCNQAQLSLNGNIVPPGGPGGMISISGATLTVTFTDSFTAQPPGAPK